MSRQGRPLIIGHSHAGALFDAAAAASIATDNVCLKFETDPFVLDGDVLTLREDLARRAREAPQVISPVRGGSFLMLAGVFDGRATVRVRAALVATAKP